MARLPFSPLLEETLSVCMWVSEYWH